MKTCVSLAQSANHKVSLALTSLRTLRHLSVTRGNTLQIIFAHLSLGPRWAKMFYVLQSAFQTWKWLFWKFLLSEDLKITDYIAKNRSTSTWGLNCEWEKSESTKTITGNSWLTELQDIKGEEILQSWQHSKCKMKCREFLWSINNTLIINGHYALWSFFWKKGQIHNIQHIKLLFTITAVNTFSSNEKSRLKSSFSPWDSLFVNIFNDIYIFDTFPVPAE